MGGNTATLRSESSVYRWFRTERIAHVASLVVLGLLVRLSIFRDVAVNGDTGLYLYDAKQLLWGRQMFVEFPSRSPLMEHLLAAVVGTAESPIVSARLFMLAIGLGLGIAIYVFARQVHSHTAGLLAMALYFFTPFSLVWGLWVKTEPVAGLLLLSAFTVAVRYIDGEELPLRATAVIGSLFALAFLVRRVAIVHIGAFAIFALWYRYRQQGDLRGTVVAAAQTLGVAAGVLAVAYVLLARGSLSMTIDIAYQHAAALFLSEGNGGLGWISLESAQPQTGTAQIPDWLRVFCRKCGKNTVQVFTRTILVTLPVLLPMVAFLRSYATKASDFIENNLLPTMLVVFAGLVLWNVPVGLYPDRVAAAIVFAAAVVVAWNTEPIDWERFWQPKYGLLIPVLSLLAAGYLYRDRIMYVTYFQDFYPYLVILSSIVAVEYYRANRRAFRGGLTLGVAVAVLVIVAGGVAGANAYPYQPSGVSEQSDWFTVDLVQEYGADIEERTDRDDRVFTAQPLYVIESDQRIAADLSRKYYLFEGWPDSPLTDRVSREVAEDLRSGKAPLAVIDGEAVTVLGNDRIREAFEANYCPVETDSYSETGGELYRYVPDASGCEINVPRN